MNALNPYLIFATGALVTVLVARYYFIRSTKKSIGAFQMLASEAFVGIEPEVRKRIKFTFEGQEVEDITQIEFIVANDGEQAISNLINPVELAIPEGAELLDASTLYREPEDLDMLLLMQSDDDEPTKKVSFMFSLLNKGEFFFVKLLFAGKVDPDELTFTLLGEDLPRTMHLKWLPSSAFRRRKFRPDWLLVFVSIFLTAALIWLVWLLTIVQGQYPEMFPLPWSTYQFTVTSLLLFLPAAIIIVVVGLLALGALLVGAFDDLTETGPRFPLPDELRHRHFRHSFAVRVPVEE